MNQKKAKSLRKEYRKEVEHFLKEGGLYELMELIIKPKPRWVPSRLWTWMTGFFINIQEDTGDAGEKTTN